MDWVNLPQPRDSSRRRVIPAAADRSMEMWAEYRSAISGETDQRKRAICLHCPYGQPTKDCPLQR